jgi:curved DNA-binding protein CbpA
MGSTIPLVQQNANNARRWRQVFFILVVLSSLPHISPSINRKQTPGKMGGKSNNPFSILGVHPSASFDTVQKKFRQLALKFHPDTGGSDTSSSSSSMSTEQFIRIRQAYERIRDGKSAYNPNSETNGLRHSRHYQQHHNYSYPRSESAFLQYFFDQTGQRLSSAQRLELIHLHRSRIPGGRYDGPAWSLAQRLAEEQEAYLSRRDHFSDSGAYPRQQAGNDSSTENYSRTDECSENALRRKRRR